MDAMLKFMAVMTHDERYETMIPVLERGEITMCDVLDRAIKQGEKEGRAEGRAEGRREIIFNFIRNGFTDEQIIQGANITPEELEAVKKGLHSGEGYNPED